MLLFQRAPVKQEDFCGMASATQNGRMRIIAGEKHAVARLIWFEA
jgi:hypothetical protein